MTLTQPQQPSLMHKSLIGYLYLIQGLAIALCATIPLTYGKMPDYATLSLFSSALLPFSFKFITAPLVEKYSLLTYGRRKFWVVVSMTVTAIMLYFISLTVNDEKKQVQTAFMLMVVGLCVSVQDISTDALGIKLLRKPQISSFLQSVYQQLGIVAGSLLLGQLTSEKFGKWLGYDSAFITPSHFILCLIPFVAIPTLLMHFYFKETCTEKQETVRRLSLWQVITHYKHFILPKYRVCRQALLFLTMFQGLTFFSAGYTVELINLGILSKQFTISLGNLSLIIIFPLTYILSKYVTKQNLQRTQFIIFTLRCLIIVGVFALNSQSPVVATIALFSLQLVSSMHFYLHGIIMNSFEDSKFEGMSVTMMASMSNLGRNSTVHLNMIGKFGFRNCVFYSFGWSAFVVLGLNKMYSWINSGKQEEEDYEQIKHQHQD